MNNPCFFSSDRDHRYSLEHDLENLLATRGRIMWIGLNPSTADENALDPTLTRISSFSFREGFGHFVMTNLFGFRATLPSVMKNHHDPVGADNDRILVETASRCEMVVAAWGADGDFQGRAAHVRKLLEKYNLVCLGLTKHGHPRHPLYVKGTTPFERYSLPLAV